MPQIISNRRKPAVAAALVLVLASLLLAACGGSSKGSSSVNATASASTSTAGGTAGAAGGRFAALRECLQKNGITLPKRTPGQGRPSGGGGGFLGGGAGPQLPKGVTRAQYEAAVKKCGGGFAGRGGGTHFNSAALKKFAACMRENGVNVPEPNTSGRGPVFNTSGLDTSSAQFKAAEAKCSSTLRSAYRASPGTGAGAPAGAAGASPSTTAN
jgi:hypothetical protein